MVYNKLKLRIESYNHTKHFIYFETLQDKEWQFEEPYYTPEETHLSLHFM
jgi:hypothetical protein